MNAILRDKRGRILPGQAPMNPGGRPRMPKYVRDLIQENGETAVMRMQALINDDTAFGRRGWMAIGTQIRLMEMAMDRAFGKPEIVRAAAPAAPVAAFAVSPDEVSQTMSRIFATMDFPERRNSKPAYDG